MNKETQSVLVGLLGGLLIGITVSGRFTSYVKPGFGPLLLTAGIILVVVAALSLVQVIRSGLRPVPCGRSGDGGGHGAEAGPGATPRTPRTSTPETRPATSTRTVTATSGPARRG